MFDIFNFCISYFWIYLAVISKSLINGGDVYGFPTEETCKNTISFVLKVYFKSFDFEQWMLGQSTFGHYVSVNFEQKIAWID